MAKRVKRQQGFNAAEEQLLAVSRFFEIIYTEMELQYSIVSFRASAELPRVKEQPFSGFMLSMLPLFQSGFRLEFTSTRLV